MELRLRSERPGALARLNASERALYARLPDEMRAFYEQHNGGFAVDEPAFDVPITWAMHGKTRHGQTKTLHSLWAFMPLRVKPAKNRPRSILREHFGRHVEEQFLPRNVFVFAEDSQSSLLAVSLNAHDHGEIYYWEWYWQYPWYKPFFLARIDEAKQRFGPGRRDLAGRELPAELGLDDALNYATLVSAAPSFDAWRAGLRIEDD